MYIYIYDYQVGKSGGGTNRVEFKSFQISYPGEQNQGFSPSCQKKNIIYIDYKTNLRDKIAKVITWAFVYVML